MRIGLIFCCLLFALLGKAQEPWHLWTHHTSQQLDAFLVQHSDSLQRYLDWGMEPDDLRNALHLVDLDADGDLDAIYIGWSGSEGNKVQFYSTVNGALCEGPLFIGDLDRVYGTRQRFFLKTLQLPCCGDVEENNVLTEIRVTFDQISYTEIDRQVRASEGIHPSWLFPDVVPFELLAERYHLRMSPVIDTTFYPYREFQEGNIYLTFSAGATGVATSMEEDATGRVWWYVIMDPQAGNTEYRFCGWMSSRFLKTRSHE